MLNTILISDQRNAALGDRKRLARLRYQRIKALPLEHVPNDEFLWATAARDKVFLGPAPSPSKPPPQVKPSAGLPPYLTCLYETALLTREQEVHLFRKMNYLKFKASRLVGSLDPERPDTRVLDRIELFYQQSVEVRNEIVRANLRLVVAMTKRYVHSSQPLFELVSDGNISLMRAVEKFDYARGARFSTYATCAIIKNFAQAIAREFRDRVRFRNAGDEVFQTATDWRIDPQIEDAAQRQRVIEIAGLLKELDDRERLIIRWRYGLNSNGKPMTLADLGSALGISKERIRQLATRAIAKLRQAAMEQGLDEPEDRPACPPRLAGRSPRVQRELAMAQ
jgi:RNA polymerase primary sigma factor/RNA polymerase sigma factor